MRTEEPVRNPMTWLLRAEQARRIAAMLTGSDAQVAESYARECEARAREPLVSRQPVVPAARRPLAA